MSGPAVTVVENGGLAVTPVEGGAAPVTLVGSGGIAVTIVESGGLPLVIEGYSQTPAPSLSSPTISLTSATGRQPTTSWAFGDDFAVNMYVLAQAASDTGFTTPLSGEGVVREELIPITMDDVVAGGEPAGVTAFLAAMPVGDAYLRAKAAHDPDPYDPENQSDWSNTLAMPVYDFVPDAFAFTDQTDVVEDTLTESDEITITGVTSGAQPAITVTGGEYAVNTGSGYGAYTSAQGVGALNATVKVRHTSASDPLTATDTVLDIEGVTDTFRTTTASSSPLPQAGSLGLWLEAAPANLFQSNAGTTAVASDGDPVGFWTDLSANGFDLSSVADDTTRPLYKTDGSVHWVEFDGTNDLLRRLAALNLWSASGYTAMIAMRSVSPVVNRHLVAQGGNESNTVLGVVGSVVAGTDQGNFYRNTAGGNVLQNSTATGAHDGNDRIITVVDNGSSVISYIDGVAGTSRSYTRAGNTFTMDRFGLGGLIRNTIGLWFPARVHGIAVWPSVVLDSAEHAPWRIYMADTLQGRTIT